MSNNSKVTGNVLENQALIKQSKKSLTGWLLNLSDNKEDAALLFRQAATTYFTENNIESAIRCLKKSTEIYLEVKGCQYNIRENTKLLIQYTKLSKNENIVLNVDSILTKLYKELAEIYAVEGDMINYNDQYVEISKIFEKNNKIEKAIEILTKCVTCKMYEKIIERKAELLLKQHKYNEAALTFQAAVAAKEIKVSTPMGSIYARPLFLMSMLSTMATKDIVAINEQMKNITKLDQTFFNSIEGKKIANIVQSFYDGNIDDFENACADYESYKPFASIQTELLVTAKEMFEEDIDLS